MKTNQLIGVIGGSLLALSLFIPSNGGMMIQAVAFISYSLLVGLIPLIFLTCGVLGAFMSYKDKGIIALICGIMALLLVLLAASQTGFGALFSTLPSAMLLIGSVLLTAGGAMSLKKA